MPRLTIPAPKIKPHKDTFDTHDQLDRRQEGEQLSTLVERFDDPMVIAVDGPWGCGKSVFLQLWVGEHVQREGNTTETVYFDAFKHDYLDDPLVALTAAVAKRVEGEDGAERKAKITKLKKAAWAIGKASLRIGANMVTFGATQHLEDLGDVIAEAVNDEAQAALNRSPDAATDTFWAAQYARIDAMDAFRETLRELTEPDEHGGPTRKLVVVVDELDRCRPDFALSVLEVIKHFFAVDGVHFVLGVNLTELENSVRARYGDRSAAGKYLEKFYSLRFTLKSRLPSGDVMAAQHFCNLHGLPPYQLPYFAALLHGYISRSKNPFAMGLRDAERIYTYSQLLLHRQTTPGQDYLLAGLIVANSVSAQFIERARKRNIEESEVHELFNFGDAVFDLDALSCWRLALGTDMFHLNDDGNDISESKRQWVTANLFRQLNIETVLQDTIVNYLDVFQLPDHL